MLAHDHLLRVYKPEECNDEGVPLDWLTCRFCNGGGIVYEIITPRLDPRDPAHEVAEYRCSACGEAGSLKDYVLHALHRAPFEGARHIGATSGTCGCLVCAGEIVRCDLCHHAMSEGRWEQADGYVLPTPEQSTLAALEMLREGQDPGGLMLQTHYSPCDEHCMHGEPGLGSPNLNLRGEMVGRVLEKAAGYGVKPMPTFEASWRGVDVRTLSWAHDLRPESLAIRCLRCYAAGARV